MNVALVVVISLVIVVPVFSAVGVMMWKSHRSQAQAEAQDKERSISTDGCSVDVECEPRLRDLVIESVRRKRASLESSGMTRSCSTSSSSRVSEKNRRKKTRLSQLTKIQSDQADTRVPSNDVVVTAV
jgi:cytoskeletal protein RodZ